MRNLNPSCSHGRCCLQQQQGKAGIPRGAHTDVEGKRVGRWNTLGEMWILFAIMGCLEQWKCDCFMIIIQLLFSCSYFGTCGGKAQKMQCNQKVNLKMCAGCGKSSSEGTTGEWSLKIDAQIVYILAKFLIVHFNWFCISCSCKVHLSYFWRLSTCTILY